ncbi:hypothetical protein CDL12_17236 [Handroanthus impetiginosus]|uniref:Uncharacterized protein n=1 Tax=Handroanthus impetiginosus TaxID=429701 RepID=A0A2G9GYU3_9LAMI|nr:hypothetical protein CDL12_17236 [Handroanthus impetiginosus]
MVSSGNTLIYLTITLSFSLILPLTNAQSPKTETNANVAIPYETVNNFCLYKRLNVNKPFCLRVLKNPQAQNAKPNDFNPLLQVAINSTSVFVCKTLSFLQDLYEDRNTKPALMPVVEECLSAYEEIAGYITNVLSDASQESAIAGLDGQVVEEYIKSCSKALERTKDPEILDLNKQAKNFAKLLIDIADSLGSKKPK